MLPLALSVKWVVMIRAHVVQAKNINSVMAAYSNTFGHW